MRAFHSLSLFAALLMGAIVPQAALAQSSDPPQGLIGAWGPDRDCAQEVAVFRTDGTVIDTGAPAGQQSATYAVTGDTLALTQNGSTARFAFAMSGGAIAWSNGVDMVLKQRCDDQMAFAAQLGHPGPVVPLYDQILALAGQTLRYGATPVTVVSVDGHPRGRSGAYDEVVAHADPKLVGRNSLLLYRIFPTVKAATDHVSLDVQAPGDFLASKRGLGTMSVVAAKDLGPGGSAPTADQGMINCVRFHPKGQGTVIITCLEHRPNTRLVAGGEQSFTLPAGATPEDLGTQDELTETLDLTSLAIDQVRGFLAANPQL
jgi:hypothetical protein